MFWSPAWLLFFLDHITLTQVGILMAISMATRILTEIPSGALSDLIGKKPTLIISFLLTGIGEFFIVTYPQFYPLILSHIVINTGYSFYSGTMDAYLYDTLLGEGRDKEYSKVLSRSNAVNYIAFSISAVIGGFIYMISPQGPWLATSGAKLTAALLALKLKEPNVDTETFSLRNFLIQTRLGFKHLFSKQLLKTTRLLITFGIFQTIAYELFDDIGVIHFGYNSIGIGLLYATLALGAVPFSLMYDKLSKKYSSYALISFAIFVLVLHYIFTPWIGTVMWTAFFALRVFFSPIRESAISEVLNRNTPSAIRATTISTYELIKKSPFLILATPIGIWVENYGFAPVASLFSLLFLITATPQIIAYRKQWRVTE